MTLRFFSLLVGLILVNFVSWLATAQPINEPGAAKLSPEEATKSFKVADDLRFDQVLAEPNVKQPLGLAFDGRGRLWVAQYIQYPHPAGLKVLSRDVFWRVVYDQVPPPPPNHFRGQDIISIHEDTQGTGVYDKHTVFLDGMNIVTSLAHGRGGVWVLNPPYLLFYPTKDGGDLPSGPPVVHLQGFGLEDTHSCANSLCWGPDGWLYGAHGSTVSAHITRPGSKDQPIQMIGQHIWRYHPEKKRFEIFAEGGGNAFGIEFDEKGRVYSGHNGGDTRGFYYVQGASYQKGFDKHGVLANPYSFGYFGAMKANKSQRFSHAFVINEAAALPERYLGKMFAIEPLQGRVMLSDITPERSSFQTRDLGPVVTSSDTWFRPVNIKPAPDGSLVVADFYEAKIAHLGHNDGVIDRETGRIYRLSARDAPIHKSVDLGKKSSAELIELLKSDNRWQRATALRLLGDRKDRSLLPALTKQLLTSSGQPALETLWAIHLTGGFDEGLAVKALAHSEPHVRLWAVRLLADDFRLGDTSAAHVAKTAHTEQDVHVRSQMAASAKRLSAAEGLPIVAGLLERNEDASDIHVPLLLWWAIEAHCAKDRDKVLALFGSAHAWNTKIAQGTILPRLMKRFAQAGAQKDFDTCTLLFRLAPEKKHGQILLKAFEDSFQGRSSAGLPDELVAEIAKLGGGSVAFGVRQGKDDAIDKALALIGDPKTPLAHRSELIEIFGEAKQPRCVGPLLELLKTPQPLLLYKAALGALQAYPEERIGSEIVDLFGRMPPEVREVAESLLVSRRAWGRQVLAAVDAGKIAPASIPLHTLRKLLLYRDDQMARIIEKHWGAVKGATTEHMRHDIERLAKVVNGGNGDPYSGKKLFAARCATCHMLHGTGGNVGPDLTPFKRDDVPSLLLHIVNPSAEIREGFEASVITTESGRILTGIIVDKDARVVVLRTADGQRTILPKNDVESISTAGVSLMPEGALDGLSNQQVRDLFAYLRSGQPLREGR